jgi:hypothetical protein
MRPKLGVLANSSGKLIAAYMCGEQELGAPTQIAFSGSSDQITREVEIPKELREVALSDEILRKYKLHLREDGCELVPARAAELP